LAKLYFRHGTMDSAKTLNLLAVAHNYRSQGKRILLVKPRMDDRFGAAAIRSRAGIEAEADLLVDDAPSSTPPCSAASTASWSTRPSSSPPPSSTSCGPSPRAARR
jgi:thymidine kinase